MRSCLPAVLAPLLVLNASSASAQEATFELAFVGPHAAGPGSVEVECELSTFGVAPGGDGALGWSLSVSETGDCRIFGYLTEGTAVDLVDTGFVIVDLTGGPGNEGLIMGCSLSLGAPETSLEPADSPHTLLRLLIGPDEADCSTCEIAYTDGLQGSGPPIDNVVIRQGFSVTPALSPPLVFEVCGCFPDEPLVTGWEGLDLGTVVGGASRNVLDSSFELCSDAVGYGSNADNVRLVSRLAPLSLVPPGFELVARVEDIAPGGVAGIELRAGSAPTASSSRVALYATLQASGKVRLTASSRETAGATAQVWQSADEVDLPVVLRLTRSLFGSGGLVASFTESDGSTTGFPQEMPVPVGVVRVGLSQASGGSGFAQARLCVIDSGIAGPVGDTDGDGCQDCVDQHPERALRLVENFTGPCCERLPPYFHFEGADTDGDGLLDCEDPDDDGDGIPDEEDPCDLGGSCEIAAFCCDIGSWVEICQTLDCEPFFAVIRPEEVVNPPLERVVFENIAIVNHALYLSPPEGVTVQESVRAIMEFREGLVIELFERGGPFGRNRLVARVGSVALDDFEISTIDAGRYLLLAPPRRERGHLTSVWAIGEPPELPRRDRDSDGVPDTFDNCPDAPNSDQLDDNGNGLGDACEPEAGGLQRPGDMTRDGGIDLADGLALLRALFQGVDALPCEGRIDETPNRTLLDSNGDRRVDISDAVSILRFLFTGTAPPILGANCVPIAGCPELCAGD